RRVETLVRDQDDLEQITGRAVYRNCRIGEIGTGRGQEFVEIKVPGGEHWLEPGQSIGGGQDESLERQMIRRTIREHLEKEGRLAPLKIKVLSLFFIDSVERYRRYEEDGHPQKGEYAAMFEDEYRRLAGHPDFQSLFREVDVRSQAQEVHDGYFSIDKKGTWSDTAE